MLTTKSENDPAYWLAVSSHAYADRRYAESIAFANRALGLRPAYAEAYNNIGAAEQGLHAWPQAIAADRRALALEPSLQIARNNLTWALAHEHAR